MRKQKMGAANTAGSARQRVAAPLSQVLLLKSRVRYILSNINGTEVYGLK